MKKALISFSRFVLLSFMIISLSVSVFGLSLSVPNMGEYDNWKAYEAFRNPHPEDGLSRKYRYDDFLHYEPFASIGAFAGFKWDCDEQNQQYRLQSLYFGPAVIPDFQSEECLLELAVTLAEEKESEPFFSEYFSNPVTVEKDSVMWQEWANQTIYLYFDARNSTFHEFEYDDRAFESDGMRYLYDGILLVGIQFEHNGRMYTLKCKNGCFGLHYWDTDNWDTNTISENPSLIERMCYAETAEAAIAEFKEMVIALNFPVAKPLIKEPPKQTTTTTTTVPVTTTTTPAPVPQNESNPLRYLIIPVAIVAVGGVVGGVWYSMRKKKE